MTIKRHAKVRIEPPRKKSVIKPVPTKSVSPTSKLAFSPTRYSELLTQIVEARHSEMEQMLLARRIREAEKIITGVGVVAGVYEHALEKLYQLAGALKERANPKVVAEYLACAEAAGRAAGALAALVTMAEGEN